MTRVLATTSSFGVADKSVDVLLAEKGIELIKNPYQRRLTSEELDQLLLEFKPKGLLAGTEPINRDLLTRHCSKLKIISRVGSGWDNVDRLASKQLGILVLRAPNSVAQPVAELTLGLFVDLSRRISYADRQLRQGIWQKPMGALITGKRFGVVGCGTVGRLICRMMQTMGCSVIAYDPFADREWFRQNNINTVDTLIELFAATDLVSIHAALTSENRAMIDQKCFVASKRDLLLVNTARAELIHTPDLIEALGSGHIGGAALDVFDREPYHGPLTRMENVVLTPHIGAYAREARIMMEMEAVNNLLAALEKIS